MNNFNSSLYSKYRPNKFEDIVGQSTVKKILVNSIITNNIHHAFLFYGIRGTGKTTLARLFAKSVNCLSFKGEPCGKCESCLNYHSSLDIIEIDAASNSGVEEIRTLIDKSKYLTTTNKYKVYIVDEVHMLSKAAFNALLKTLEEPPKNVLFLLATTEINKIPKTILSRSLIMNLEPISVNDIDKQLEKILKKEDLKYEKEALKYISSISGGSLRDAITNLETIVLFSKEVNKENIINALKLIDFDELKDNILNDIPTLVHKIENKDLNIKKIILLTIEIITKNIQTLDSSYYDLLEKLLNMIVEVQDQEILNISFRTILLKFWNVKNVPRETFVEPKVVDNKEEAKKFNDKKVNMTEKEEEIKQSLEDLNKELIMENKEIDKKVDEEIKHGAEIQKEVIEWQEKTEEVPKTIKTTHIKEKSSFNKEIINWEDKTEEIQASEIKKDVAQLQTSIKHNPKKEITTYITPKHYLSIIMNLDVAKFKKAQKRWSYLTKYNKSEWKKYISILSDTQILGIDEQGIIVGFTNDLNYSLFKSISLERELFNLMLEVFGSKLYVLPVLPETWTKLLTLHKKIVKGNKIISEKIKIPNIKEEDNNDDKNLKEIFGSKLKFED